MIKGALKSLEGPPKTLPKVKSYWQLAVQNVKAFYDVIAYAKKHKEVLFQKVKKNYYAKWHFMAYFISSLTSLFPFFSLHRLSMLDEISKCMNVGFR